MLWTFFISDDEFFLVDSKCFGPRNDKSRNCLVLFQTGEFYLMNLLKARYSEYFFLSDDEIFWLKVNVLVRGMIKVEIALSYFKQVNSSWRTCWKLEKETQMANTKHKWKSACGRWHASFSTCLPNYALRETNIDGSCVVQELMKIHRMNELCSVREIRILAARVIYMKTTVCLV